MPRCDTRKAYSGPEAERFRLRNLFPDQQVAAIVEQLDNAEGVRPTGEVSRALFSQGYLRYRFQRAGEIAAPVMLIAGGKDYQTALEPQVEMASDLRDAEMLVYPRSGHFMFVDEPRRFARDVDRFLRSVKSTRRRASGEARRSRLRTN